MCVHRLWIDTFMCVHCLWIDTFMCVHSLWIDTFMCVQSLLSSLLYVCSYNSWLIINWFHQFSQKVPFLHGFYKELVHGMEFHVSITKFYWFLVGQDLHGRKIYGGVHPPLCELFWYLTMFFKIRKRSSLIKIYHFQMSGRWFLWNPKGGCTSPHKSWGVSLRHIGHGK